MTGDKAMIETKSEIDQQMDELNEIINRIDEITNALVSTLDSVLAPLPDTKEDQNEVSVESSLGRQIQEARQYLQRLHYRLVETRDRIRV